jgi:hypothetical protein
VVDAARASLGASPGTPLLRADPASAARWGALDDVVMGGVSESGLALVPGGGEGGAPALVFRRARGPRAPRRRGRAAARRAAGRASGRRALAAARSRSLCPTPPPHPVATEPRSLPARPAQGRLEHTHAHALAQNNTRTRTQHSHTHIYTLPYMGTSTQHTNALLHTNTRTHTHFSRARPRGVVSTDNSGGFASVRCRNWEPPLDLGAYEGVRLRLRGDGQRWGSFGVAGLRRTRGRSLAPREKKPIFGLETAQQRCFQDAAAKIRQTELRQPPRTAAGRRRPPQVQAHPPQRGRLGRRRLHDQL